VRRWQVAGIAVVGIVAILVALSLAGDDDPDGLPEAQGATNPIPGLSERVDGPVLPDHCGGSETTLQAEISRAKDYAILVPDSGASSPETMTSVLRCPDGGTRLEFASGVSVYLARNTIPDPEKAWQSTASTAPDIYSVGTVAGVPAFFADPSKDKSGVADGSVVAVIGRTFVAVVGDGEVPLSDLIETATTLKEASSG
jgi:hypothetical protein